MRWVALVLASSLLCLAADKKDKAKAASSQMVDSGTFGIFIKGQRVVNETFTIEQKDGVSVIKSQLKEIAGNDSATQKSDLQITSTGDLLRYDWTQGASGSLSVVPSNDFLMEKVTASPSNKTAEKPFLMPSSSPILDNNFFVQREVLVWKYLAADCKQEAGAQKCQQGPATFGVLVPQDQTSMNVKLELIGKEKITLKGAERELLRLNLTGEGFDWALWVDDHDSFKLMKVAIPADKTEVVRD
ncbi:MAG: hypothetical protein ACRD3B_01685 [Candidatus Sulfotelmatobacter sp.]